MLAFQYEDEERGRTVTKHKQYGDDAWQTDHLRPYFYVDASEGYRLPDGIPGKVERNVDVRGYDGAPLDRVVLRSTRDARDAREEAENHYEADIPFERRFYIDRIEGSMAADGDISEARPHIMHVDIEVWADGGNVDAMEAAEPILSISCYSEKHGTHADLLLRPEGWDADNTERDEKNREYVEPEWGDGGKVYLFDREEAMIGAFARLIKRSGVEVLTGWNFEWFDATYLINRAEKLQGIAPSVFSPLSESYVSQWFDDEGNEHRKAVIKGIDVFDMMEAYKHLKRRDKPPNWQLGTVAEYEGADVTKMDVDASRVGPLWERDPMKVMEYNRRDAVLTHHVQDALGAFDLFLEIHRQFAIPLPDTLNNSVLVEMYVMSRAPAWGIRDRILDSKRTDVNDFEGGNTREPNEGVYDWVFSADVTSEYPNWVRAANLSPETVVTPEDDEWERDDLIETPRLPDPPEDVEDPDHHDGDYLPVKFLPHDEKLGILPRAVDEMFVMKEAKTEKRARHEYGTDGYEQADLERDATKWFLNSIQGVTGMETHRLSKNEVSASITAFGRETIDFMVDIGEEMGYYFVYGDTDSAFFTDRSGDRVYDLETAVRAVKALANRTNDQLPLWAQHEYGIEDERRHNLEVEPEKVAKRAFFPNKKKRYSLRLVWNDGEEVDDKVDHTGWAIVRSDTSVIEERVQRKTLEAVLHGKGEGYVTDRLIEEMEKAASGDYGSLELARPQGSSKPFDQYGDHEGVLDFENVPYFVSAMVSSNEILGTNYQGGDKAWMLAVEETETVTVETENGRSTNSVNYLAIDEDTELPELIHVDYGWVLDNIIGKVERVYDSLDWNKTRLTEKRRELLDDKATEQTRSEHRTLEAFTT